MSQITSTNDLKTLTGNGGGGPVSPSSGNITIVGGDGIAVTGDQGAHTITISNTGAEASTFETDLGGPVTPTDGVIQIKGFPGGNITTYGQFGPSNLLEIAISGTTEFAVQTGNIEGDLTSLAVGNDGEVLIGANNAPSAFAPITSTSGSLSFVAGPNSLDINVVGGGIPWSTIAINTSLAANNGYVTAGAAQLSLLLPATSVVGDIVHIVDSGQAGINSPWRITQGAGQRILAALGNATTLGAGGYLEATGGNTDSQFSAITLRCIVANTLWIVESATVSMTFN